MARPYKPEPSGGAASACGAVPIPTRCVHRPLIGGLVVPWVTFKHPHDGYRLGHTRLDRMIACVRYRICQLCGDPLQHRVVVLCRAQDLAVGYSAEPGMHPECAAYASKACPMMTGRMEHYRRAPFDLAAQACDDPACTCHRFRGRGDPEMRAGQPADEFLAIWLALDEYRPTYGPDGVVCGAALRGVPFLRIRPVEAPHRTGPEGAVTKSFRLLDALDRLTGESKRCQHEGE